MSRADDRILAVKLRRLRPGDKKILVDYQCAALMGLLASGIHSERCDREFVMRFNCQLAKDYANEMLRLSGL